MKIKRLLTVTLAVFSVIVSAQEKVSGKVTSQNGENLSDVYITTKEGSSESFTEEDGTYSIELDSEEKTLIFEYLEADTKEVPVTGSVINVVLNVTDENQIGDVVVTGFQKIDRKLFTGAGERLKAEDVVIAGVPDVTRALQGQVAGVEVQNVSGTFGSAPVINIRGNSSINGNNKPLWVIDGVVQEDLINVSADDLTSGNLNSILTSGIAGINPEDIKDIQILKDVSATGIYGAQAMNGVIVITTKKGRKGKPRINYKLSTSIREAPDASDFDILDAGSELDIYRRMYDKGYLQTTELVNAENYGMIGVFYQEVANGNLGWNANPNNTNGWNESFLQYYALQNTDWFEELFNNNITTQHSLSISGAGEKSNYYASIGYFNDSGATESNKVDNYTALFKTDFDLSDKLSLGFKLSGNVRYQTVPGTRDREYDPLSGQFDRDFDINPFSYALNTSRLMAPYDQNGDLLYVRSNYAPFNIFYELEHNKIDLTIHDITLQGNVAYKFKDNLTGRLLLQGRSANTLSEHKIHETSNGAEAYRADYTQGIVQSNRFLFDDPDRPLTDPYSVLPEGGFYNVEENSLKNYYIRTQLDWSPKIGEDHEFNFLFANEVKYTDRTYKRNDGWGIVYDRGGLVTTHPDVLKFLDATDQQIFEYEEFRDRFIGNVITAGYAYKDRYILNGMFRYDGSNQLGNTSSARWLPTWNVSAGWNVHEENFLKDSNLINLLKLKGTYGVAGVVGPDANAVLTLYGETTNRISSSDDETGLLIDGLQNDDLTWEKLNELNLGFELGLWNNRIFTEFNYYDRTSEDLIDFITTSGIGGITVKYGNIGDMDSNGVEWTLKTKNIDNTNFGWTSQFTFNYHESEITRFDAFSRIGDVINGTGGALLGYPQRGLFSIPFAGLNDKGIPTFYDNEGNIVTNINLQNRTDIADWLVYEGPIAPTYTGGFINRFRYKNWNLGINIVYKGGNKIRLNDIYKANYDGILINDFSAFSQEVRNRWMLPGDENITNIPSIPDVNFWDKNYDGENAYALYNNSSARVADGDFVRLKDINLSYTLPKEWTQSLSIERASLAFNVNNIWLIYSDDKLNGVDPEFFNSGGVALPMQRMYTFTLNVNF